MFTKTILASLAVAGTLAGASMLSSTAASAAPWCGHPGQPPCGMPPGPPGPPPPGPPPGPGGGPGPWPHHHHGPGGPGVNFGVIIDGGGYGGPGYGYGGPSYGGRFVTCSQAKQIVRYNGFFGVRTQSCGGPVYSFTGLKHGRPYEVDVSRRGRIVNVDPAY